MMRHDEVFLAFLALKRRAVQTVFLGEPSACEGLVRLVKSVCKEPRKDMWNASAQSGSVGRTPS